jgi:hypothetical protein
MADTMLAQTPLLGTVKEKTPEAAVITALFSKIPYDMQTLQCMKVTG